MKNEESKIIALANGIEFRQCYSGQVTELGSERNARGARGRKEEPRKTTNSARERGEPDRRRSGLQTAGCDREREDASGGDGSEVRQE